jgi:all-trans-retinol 13,14-reductase
MFEQMMQSGDLGTAELYFGCRTAAEDLTKAFACLPPRTDPCLSRAVAACTFQGRVTRALAGLQFNPATTDFYVCGSAAMVADCTMLLQRAGAQQILTEPF